MQVALLWNVDKNKDGKEKETGKSRGRGRDKGEVTCYAVNLGILRTIIDLYRNAV